MVQVGLLMLLLDLILAYFSEGLAVWFELLILANKGGLCLALDWLDF